MPLDLQYASPGIRKSRPILYRLALACALLPLSFGVGVFLLWLIVGGEPLMVVGFVTLPIGCVLVVIGFGHLIAYEWVERRVRVGLDPKALKRRRWAIGLLLVNFPVAIVCAVTALHLTHRKTFVVKNTSSSTIDSFVVITGEGPAEWGPILPNHSARLRFLPADNYTADYTMQRAGKESKATIRWTTSGAPEAHYLDVYDGSVSDTVVHRLW
jgi:hypothetical protein